MDRGLYERIVSEYRKSGSVDLTAKACGTYAIKVRKVLITENLWHSRKSDAVNALRQRGYSVAEIAEKLGMDEKNVQFYLPYTQSALTGERAESSERVQAYRERSRNAAEGCARERGSDGRPEGTVLPGPADRESVGDGHQVTHSYHESVGELNPTQAPLAHAPQVTHLLRAELVRNCYDPEEDCEDIFEGETDPDVLRVLLKTKEGISRDLIVPGGMSLHQLSYALQQAFGFQNCHLHHFSLPKKLLRQLTKDNTGCWAEMCGVYLHAPVAEDFDDLYWDDDYREGKSPKTWMKSKYTGDPVDYAVGETYIDSLRLMKEEREWVQEQLARKRNTTKEQSLKTYEDLTIEEHGREYFPEANLNRVLERLKIREIFDTVPLSPDETEAWRKEMREQIGHSRRYLEACREALSFQSLEAAMDALRFLRTERHRVEQVIWMRRNGVKDEYKGRPEELLDEIDQEIRELEDHIGEAMHAFDPPAEPITDTLYYNYDYGDDWLIRITCRDIYTRRDYRMDVERDPEEVFEEIGTRAPELEKKLKDHVLQRDFSDEYEYENDAGERVNTALRSALLRAELEKTPVCVRAEGLPPVEDVGGVGGFFEFLRTIHGADAEEEARMRQWARGLGWKEVRPRAEGLL